MQLLTEVEINAPRKAVWDVLTHFQAYHEWNPFITTLMGPMKVGERISVTISPPESSDFRFTPVLLTYEEEKEIRWRGKMFASFIFGGEHYLTLHDVGNGRTRVVHGEEFEGFLLKFMKREMGATARGFALMNQALKRRVEAHHAAQG